MYIAKTSSVAKHKTPKPKLNYSQLLKKLTWLYALCRLPLPAGAQPKHRQVFHHMAMLCNIPQNATCTPSYQYLAEVTGYGITTIKGILLDLIGWELISKKARYNNSNVYCLHWEQLEGAEATLHLLAEGSNGEAWPASNAPSGEPK
jgi:hypothetical protein